MNFLPSKLSIQEKQFGELMNVFGGCKAEKAYYTKCGHGNKIEVNFCEVCGNNTRLPGETINNINLKPKTLKLQSFVKCVELGYVEKCEIKISFTALAFALNCVFVYRCIIKDNCKN